MIRIRAKSLLCHNSKISSLAIRLKNSDSRTLPSVFYIQNPLAWIINKFEFKTLRKVFDPSFNEKDFIYGTKKAVSVICYIISKNSWSDLDGLMEPKEIDHLRKEVETKWPDDKRRQIAFSVDDIQIAVSRRVFMRSILGDGIVEIDMIFVALKFAHLAPSSIRDIVFIELMARFTRTYSPREITNWTVSNFKISKFDIVKR